MEDEVEVFFLSFLAKDFGQEEERNEEIFSNFLFKIKIKKSLGQKSRSNGFVTNGKSRVNPHPLIFQD